MLANILLLTDQAVIKKTARFARHNRSLRDNATNSHEDARGMGGGHPFRAPSSRLSYDNFPKILKFYACFQLCLAVALTVDAQTAKPAALRHNTD